MAKVQHFSGISKRIPFEGFDFYDLFRVTFENSELGRMKRLLPLHEMAVNFGLVSNHPVRKRGRPSAEKKREEDYVRKELARVRATQMEGSFGTQKEHYAMRRIKARKKKTEILYIFFGIHTANAVHLAGRLAGLQETKAA